MIFYIYSQIGKAGITDAVVIDAEDTDVFVLSFYATYKTEGIIAIKQKKDIINCRELCSQDNVDILITLHIHTGSGTTSGFFGHGKKTVDDKGTKMQEACS